MECLTILSSSASDTRWKACKECGSSSGGIGSHEPTLGALILMRMCQLKVREVKKKLSETTFCRMYAETE